MSLVSATVSISLVTSSRGRSAARARNSPRPSASSRPPDGDEQEGAHETAQFGDLTVDVDDEQLGRRGLDQARVTVRARLTIESGGQSER